MMSTLSSMWHSCVGFRQSLCCCIYSNICMSSCFVNLYYFCWMSVWDGNIQQWMQIYCTRQIYWYKKILVTLNLTERRCITGKWWFITDKRWYVCKIMQTIGHKQQQWFFYANNENNVHLDVEQSSPGINQYISCPFFVFPTQLISDCDRVSSFQVWLCELV